MAHADVETASLPEQLATYAQEQIRRRGKLRSLGHLFWTSVRGNPARGLPRQGLWRGTLLWLEAVVVPYYGNWISAAVYFGAALLLLLVGLRRFSHLVGDGAIIAALAVESFLLLLLSLSLFAAAPTAPATSAQELTDWVSQLAIDMTEMADSAGRILSQQERLLQQWQHFGQQQHTLLQHLATLSESLRHLPAPTAELLDALHALRQSLASLEQQLQRYSEELQHWRTQELQLLVRQELAQLLSAAAANRTNPRGQE